MFILLNRFVQKIRLMVDVVSSLYVVYWNKL